MCGMTASTVLRSADCRRWYRKCAGGGESDVVRRMCQETWVVVPE